MISRKSQRNSSNSQLTASYRAYLEKKSAPPKNPGSKHIPEGSENCLQSMTFVFTGELESIGREEASDLVKKCGGKVTTSPSSRTTFVVVGSDAGPKKLEKIKELKIATLTEDEFFDLIREKSAHSKMTLPKREEQQTFSICVEEKEKALVKESKVKSLIESKGHETQLWTEKYRPHSFEEFIGNQTNLTKLAEFLNAFDPNGTEKDGFRAALLSGPPGIGKTSAALMVSEMEGFKVVEFNASDTRSKKSLHVL